MKTANVPGLLRWDFIFHCAICQASVMMRRCLFSKQGYHYLENLRTAADFELWTRIIQTNKIANQIRPAISIDGIVITFQ